MNAKVIAIIIVLVICVLAGVFIKSQAIRRNDVSFAFVGDLQEFVQANDLRFPEDWSEFEKWYEKSHDRRRWVSADLEVRFSVPWGIDLSTAISNETKMITVLDPQLEAVEEGLNSMFRRQVSGLVTPSSGVSIGQE